ncbi:hypothetical protein [Lacrimispora sp.]|uniref:hypothetical protein n=1 Tax=Lacrimispora sp. TaxID=2719234 RepID=UPI0028AA3A03|nr:hypothetical protein [Lacrimispora sp.]
MQLQSADLSVIPIQHLLIKGINYADGSGAYEYVCEAVIGGIKYDFKLIFRIIECK